MKSWLVIAALVVVALGCTDEKASKTAARQSSEKLCAVGGARFDAQKNECVCPEGAAWGGVKCEATAEPVASADAGAASASASATTSTSTSTSTSTTTGDADAPVVGGGAADGEISARVKAACKKAKGYWLEKDGYCHCARGRVLVGERCRMLPGRATPDVCKRSVVAGKWRGGRCECGEGLVFAPSRGGCVPPRPADADAAVDRRVCESSLNGGRWDARADRCRCPDGRVMVGETCEPQERLSSREVCESEANRGTWSKDGKRCTCPDGALWIDQACKAPARVGLKEACEREESGGRYDAALARCICPGLKKWRAEAHACR